MLPPPLGIGLIGTGLIADFHAQALARIPELKLVAVASRSLERAQSFAGRHGIPFATESIAALCAHPEIRAVSIATPSGAHLEPALEAIRAGKHVIIEKPVEISTERIDQILRAAGNAGVRVGAIFQARFGRGAQALKAAIDAGRFGRLVLASAQVKWHRPREYYQGWKGVLALDGGGAVMNQAIHGLDLLQWFAGLPSEVFAWTTRRVHTRIEAEDTACASLRFPGGALGSIEATTAAWPGWSRRIELCGEQGSAALEDDRIVRWDFAPADEGDRDVVQSFATDQLGAGAASPGGIAIEGHVRQFADFASALRTGQPLAVDGREARRAVALIRALYDSAALSQPVPLDPSR